VPSGRAREITAASMFAAHARFDASRLLSYCGRCNAAVPGAELGIADLVAFAVSRVLLDFPCLNAQVFDGEARLFAHVHLGIAVDTPQGLLFPTLRNADTKSLIALSRETRDLAALCREGKALPEDLADGTFSLSDIGACNVDCFTPIINPPQVAALGIGGLGYKRKKTGDGMADYPALGLSLSVDRRAAPGAPAAAFLEALCGELENFPLLLAK
jgi:pyruvate dehydrogenase E2 component (dihydrolipoamide acetyltransferase)